MGSTVLLGFMLRESNAGQQAKPICLAYKIGKVLEKPGAARLD